MKEDGIKIFNIVEEIKGYQKEIARLKELEEKHRELNGELREENKQLKEEYKDNLNEILSIVCVIEHNLEKFKEVNVFEHLDYAENKVMELNEYLYELLKGDNNEIN